MALKITSNILTDRGQTSECYVRINQYYIDKMSGYLKIDLGVYLNKDVADDSKPAEFGEPSMQNTYMCKTYQIPENILLEFYKEVDGKKKVDFSEFNDSPDSFSYLYDKVKSKLMDIFGSDKVVNI
jgi:hypothetical protein